MRNEQDRITWRVGAAGVLVGVALAVGAGVASVGYFRVQVHDTRPADAVVDQPAPVPAPVVEAPVVEVTPTTEPPTSTVPATVPHVDRTAPLDQRVDNLDQRVTNLEDTTTTTSTTVPTPTTTH